MAKFSAQSVNPRSLFVDLLLSFADYSKREAQITEIDITNLQLLGCFQLYFSLLDLYEPGLLLISKNHRAAAAMILRSMFEARVDLALLARDPDHLDMLLAKFMKGSIKAFGIAEKYNRDSETMKEWREQTLFRRALLKEKNIQILNIEQRAEKANLEEEYHLVYQRLSEDAHHDLSALERRHMRKLGDKIELVIREKLSLVEFLSYGGTMFDYVYAGRKAVRTLAGRSADTYVSQWETFVRGYHRAYDRWLKESPQREEAAFWKILDGIIVLDNPLQ